MEEKKQTFSMFQPTGDPFILAISDPDDPKKFFSWAICEYIIGSDNKILLWFIYTLPKHRRQGNGLRLIRKLQEVHNEIETHVITKNGEGESLCLAGGFKLIRAIHKNGIDKLVWKKPTKKDE